MQVPITIFSNRHHDSLLHLQVVSTETGWRWKWWKRITKRNVHLVPVDPVNVITMKNDRYNPINK